MVQTTFTHSHFVAALAFDAIFILVGLIQIILAIHVLRPSNPLQTSTYFLIAGCIANIAAWSISMVVDVWIVTGPIEITEKLLSMTLAIGILGGVGSALIALALVRIISASFGGHPWAPVKWLIAIILLCLAIDLAVLGTRYTSAIAAVQHPVGYNLKWWYYNVRCLALGAFQIVLYVGWKPVAYEKYPSLLLIKRVVLPAFAIQWTLAIINLLGRNAPDPPTDDAYNVVFGILINAFEPLIVGCLLRVAYVW